MDDKRRARIARVPDVKLPEFLRSLRPAGGKLAVDGLGLPPGTSVIETQTKEGCLLVKLYNLLFDPCPDGTVIPNIDLEFTR